MTEESEDDGIYDKVKEDAESARAHGKEVGEKWVEVYPGLRHDFMWKHLDMEDDLPFGYIRDYTSAFERVMQEARL